MEKLCSRVGLYGSGGRQYGVVIDAGSTGSRVLGFSFHRSIIDNSLRLDDELWKQVKPGLSFYNEQPENCSHGMIKSYGISMLFYENWNGICYLLPSKLYSYKTRLDINICFKPTITFLGLVELLDAAKTFIPKEYWKTTPITLKATAGLRLLPKEEGDAILEVARKVRLILTP